MSKILYEGRTGEYEEKKSRFIATLFSVDSEEEALRYIEMLKKKYWDARHNCYAYVIGDNNELARFSDDGEPQGTAGKPILEVLMGEEVHNALIVVTRYFGGTLLGTGGLVRAYTKASKDGLNNSIILDKTDGYAMEIRTDYNGIGKLQYLFGQKEIDMLDSEYGQEVFIRVAVPVNREEEIIKAVTEVTAGRAQIARGDTIAFAKYNKDIILF